jgi:hypothetical protein
MAGHKAKEAIDEGPKIVIIFLQSLAQHFGICLLLCGFRFKA